jgi:hypothetical protein
LLKERASLFSIYGTLLFQCALECGVRKQWDVTEYATGIVVSLENNTSSTQSELVIQPNSLKYGVYKFNFTVIANYTYNGNQQEQSAHTQTIIEIVPTGIQVIGILGGISAFTIGSSQSFTLDPSVYSYDFDGIANTSQLSFQFFCQTQSQITNMVTISTELDLYSLAVYRNETSVCFNNMTTG